jgi:hypothetical protein
MKRVLFGVATVALALTIGACTFVESLIGPVEPPDTPTNFGIVKLTASSFTLSWIDNAENEEGFKVERRIGTDTVWQQVATVGQDVTTYEDSDLSSSDLHFYRVRAYNREGDSDYTTDVSAFLTPGEVLEPSLTITSPETGATVSSPLEVAFEVSDWDLESGDGKPTHFHAFVNNVDESGAVYELTPWSIALDPGTYTITLKLANADHKFIGVEDTIEITVE